MARRRIAILVFAVVPVGCTILYSPDGFDRLQSTDASTVDAVEAATPEASRPDAEVVEAGDADAAPPLPNLAPSADLATCEPWGRYQATLTPDSLGRTGGGCRVCADNGTRQVFSIDGDTMVMNLVPGDVVYGEIWARAASGASGLAVFPALRSQTTNYVHLDVVEGPTQTLSADTWTKLTVTFQATQSAAVMDMYVITTNAKPGQCFVVDDARVERRP